MNATAATLATTAADRPVRVGNRRKLAVAGRLTWRDANGTLRFASVVTRDVSETDVFVECQGPASIPKFRLVHFQVERSAQGRTDLPAVASRRQAAVGHLPRRTVRVGDRHAKGVCDSPAERAGDGQVATKAPLALAN